MCDLQKSINDDYHKAMIELSEDYIKIKKENEELKEAAKSLSDGVETLRKENKELKDEIENLKPIHKSMIERIQHL